MTFWLALIKKRLEKFPVALRERDLGLASLIVASSEVPFHREKYGRGDAPLLAGDAEDVHQEDEHV